VPLAWDELSARLRPQRWTIKTVPKRVAETRDRDPWERYFTTKQRLPL
jgi:DNA primase